MDKTLRDKTLSALADLIMAAREVSVSCEDAGGVIRNKHGQRVGRHNGTYAPCDNYIIYDGCDECRFIMALRAYEAI